MFDGRWRDAVDRTTKPVGATLVRMGVTADVLTIFGLAMSVVTAFVVGSGHLVLGVVMLFPTGLPDLFDGPVAKASGRASVRGAFFDSVADRIADAFLLGGVAWYLAARHHGLMVLLPFAVLAMTSLISYQRAKAELLGLSARGGLMERAERFILLGAVFVAGSASASAFVPALWVFFALISATAAGRFVAVWREAEGPPPIVRRTLFAEGAASARPGAAHEAASDEVAAHGPAAHGALARWRQGRVDSRWRTWREARAQREVSGLRGIPRRAAQPSGRWRARRAGVPSSRTGRIWRARSTSRAGRRPGSRGT
jgi:CDP-diacylglycerol---glycerol-3-phosphate 3-phosphatidyltransferase